MYGLFPDRILIDSIVWSDHDMSQPCPKCLISLKSHGRDLSASGSVKRLHGQSESYFEALWTHIELSTFSVNSITEAGGR